MRRTGRDAALHRASAAPSSNGEPSPVRRRMVVASLCAVAWPAQGAPVLPLASSLPDEMAAAARAGQPLLVMVSLDGCGYCRVVRDQYLVPLRREQGLPVVQVDMRSARAITDAAGQVRTHDQLVRAWRIETAPTVLFLGAGGRELAPRLRGMSSADFYGAYLAEHIEKARRALRS